MHLVASRTPGAGFIDVRLVNRESKKFYVAGEVNAPGSFPFTGEETVLDAVTAAGGLTEKASRWDIILSRPTPPNGCRIILAVNYWDILQLGDTTTNYKLLPGDRVYVPTRTLLENLCGGGKKFWKWERRPQVSCPLPPLGTTSSRPGRVPSRTRAGVALKYRDPRRSVIAPRSSGVSGGWVQGPDPGTTIQGLRTTQANADRIEWL